MAQEMEKEDICKTFIARSQNYVNVFDGATKFFRPKRMDGNWEAPFKPLEVDVPIRRPLPGNIVSLCRMM